jgi:hypothetical protein
MGNLIFQLTILQNFLDTCRDGLGQLLEVGLTPSIVERRIAHLKTRVGEETVKKLQRHY